MTSLWKIRFINPPEVQGQVVRSKGMMGYDSRKIAQNRTCVKRDFGLLLVPFFRLIFVRETTTYWGWYWPIKVC